MRGINHFIVEVKDPFKDKIEVGNIELFIDKQILRERSANLIGKVVNNPAFNNSNHIPIGSEVLIDASTLYRQIYKGQEQESVHLVDAKKMHYKVEPEMIVMFRESSDAQWVGYQNNLMITFIKKKSEERSGILFSTPKEEFVKGKAVVKFRNEELKNNGIENGQEVFINPSCGISVYFENETMYWVRSKDILAV